MYLARLCLFKHVTPKNCSCNLLHLLDKHDVEDVRVFLWTRWTLLASPKSWILRRLPTYLKESLFFRAGTVAQLLLQKLAYFGCDRTVLVRTALPGSRLCCSGKQMARTDRQHAQRHILTHPKTSHVPVTIGMLIPDQYEFHLSWTTKYTVTTFTTEEPDYICIVLWCLLWET